ncbi:hypothetical protein R1sor_026387 [Riccia sorocarpa]|uniref:DUF659 domain-containing protein n=1 Tax=Riccia sorocarpa TaxID=122646 RepID=A0ABD3GDB2_9MARC
MDVSRDGDVGDEQDIRDPSGDDGGTRDQHQQRPPNARQTTLPFDQAPPPPTHTTNYKDFGLPEPRTELSIKIMEQFQVMRSVKKDVEGVWCKCRWCGNLYGPNVTRLTQRFTNEFAPRQRRNIKTPAHRREGSNKHIKGCERASERFKLQIRELNSRQRARAAELALLPELASSSRALDEEEREIESALPGSIIKEEPIQGGRLPSARATEMRPQQSNFSSPSSVANADTPSNNNVQGSQSFPRHAATSTQRKSVQLSIKPMMDAAQREKADKLWSLAQAVTGLPFHAFKHPVFEETYRFSSQFPGYKLPSEKRLRTTLLDANYETVREETEKKMFDHMVWDKITISCDGWTNRNGCPQMNMLHISRHGQMAHRHVDGSNETKSAVWIAEHIMKDIEERGPPNVLQFVADNASANILAGKLVRERYPHIIFGGCVAHGLDLLMEDIGKLPWVKEVVNDCKSFIKFIKNHHMTNAIFLDFFSNGATLLKPAATRFATNVIMLDRAWTLSSSLRRMVISDRWISWANDPQRPPQTRTDAREAKETILDERFWDKVHDIVMMMEKIFVLLRQVDSHKDFLGRVFMESWECQDILKNLHTSTELRSNIITPSSCDELFLLFRHRWNGWTNIIHTTAMLFNPAYLFDEERQEFSYHSFIMRDFQEYVTLFAKEVLKISGEELENRPEIALSNGEKVRVKTWDWTEPVSVEEVLEDTLQARTMRNAPVDGKVLVGSTEPTENIVYYDDLADHDFPDDSEMSLDDSGVLPGMEVRDEDTLDAYFDVTSEVLPIEAIRNYIIVDDIDKTKAWTLGVGEERLKQLNSRFGVSRFPHVTLNVPGVTLTTKKTRILHEIYNMPGRRTDSFDLENPRKRPKHSSSRLKPTERAGTSQRWENVVDP